MEIAIPLLALGGMYVISNQNNKNFLIDQSPAHLPFIISDLVGVADLETASKNLFSEVDRYSKDVTKIEKEINSLETDLEQYKNLDDDIEKHNNLKIILDNIDDEKTTRGLNMTAICRLWNRPIPTKPKTHNPVDDAMGNAEALLKMKEMGLKIDLK